MLLITYLVFEPEIRYFVSICSLVFSSRLFGAKADESPEYLFSLGVEKALEHKYPNTLQGVEDGESVGYKQIVKGEEEETKDPGTAKQTDEDPYTLHVHDQVRVRFHLLDHHRVNSQEEHGDVANDDENGGDDEAEYKVVMDRQPAVVPGAVAAEGDGVETHVCGVVLSVDSDVVDDEGPR